MKEQYFQFWMKDLWSYTKSRAESSAKFFQVPIQSIRHRSNAAKVTDMHEARVGEMSEVIEEAKVVIKNYI